MLSTTIAYSNTVFLNPNQYLILNRWSFLLHICVTESYQINFLPEKLNLMTVTTGHISSITLISFSTADLYQPDLVPESPWREAWSFRSEILDCPSDTISQNNWKTPTSKIFFSFLHYTSAVKVTNTKVTHTLHSKVFWSTNFGAGDKCFPCQKTNSFIHT